MELTALRHRRRKYQTLVRGGKVRTAPTNEMTRSIPVPKAIHSRATSDPFSPSIVPLIASIVGLRWLLARKLRRPNASDDGCISHQSSDYVRQCKDPGKKLEGDEHSHGRPIRTTPPTLRHDLPNARARSAHCPPKVCARKLTLLARIVMIPCTATATSPITATLSTCTCVTDTTPITVVFGAVPAFQIE